MTDRNYDPPDPLAIANALIAGLEKRLAESRAELERARDATRQACAVRDDARAASVRDLERARAAEAEINGFCGFRERLRNQSLEIERLQTETRQLDQNAVADAKVLTREKQARADFVAKCGKELAIGDPTEHEILRQIHLQREASYRTQSTLAKENDQLRSLLASALSERDAAATELDRITDERDAARDTLARVRDVLA